MITRKITLLLEDAFASSFLVHSSAILGERMSEPLVFAEYPVKAAAVIKLFNFRASLLEKKTGKWLSALDGFGGFSKFFTDLDLESYLRASELNMPSELFEWYKAGKRVWYTDVSVEESGDQHGPDIVRLCRKLPSEPTMIWFENPVSARVSSEKVVSCNLVLYTKIGNDLLLRFFINPVETTQGALMSLKDQSDTSRLILKPGKKKVWIDTANHRRVQITRNELRAWQKLSDCDKALSRYYLPNGMAGAMVALIKSDPAHIMISASAQKLVTQVIGATLRWCEEREKYQQVTLSEGDSKDIGVGSSIRLPRQQQVFAPEEVFTIRRTSYESASARGSRSHHRKGTGRVVTVEHTRSEHERTLYRGTTKERKILVKEAHVVPRAQPPGVLIKSPRKK